MLSFKEKTVIFEFGEKLIMISDIVRLLFHVYMTGENTFPGYIQNDNN